MRRVLYITGTRADFGLMESTLQLIGQAADLELGVCVTGTHLDEKYGKTVDLIRSSGITIEGEIQVSASGESGQEMVDVISRQLSGLNKILADVKPDILLLLGDRGEMLAGAIAALHLNIPIVHIHGGERSGTVDEPIRHAISKLAHYHFTATEGAKARLIKMGERAESVFVTGAPGLNGLKDIVFVPQAELYRKLSIADGQDVCLFLYHPVVQNQRDLLEDTRGIARALIESGMHILWFAPNSDAGGAKIDSVLKEFEHESCVSRIENMPREEFLSWLNVARCMVGNSSSGIIEAASFGLNVLNIGLRQHLRERSENVIDVAEIDDSLPELVQKLKMRPRFDGENVYFRAGSAAAIVSLLGSVSLSNEVLNKVNAY